MSQTEPGWYNADGDPPGTMRYWDGAQWIGEPTAQAPTYSGAGTGYTYGGAGERLGAQIIDFIILAIVGVVLALVFGVGLDFTQTPTIGFILIGLIIGVLYDIGLIATQGATLGKRILGLKVVNESHDSPPGWGPAALRWIPTLLGSIPLIGALIAIGQAIASGVMISSDDQNRSVGDRIGKTYVIKTR